MKFVLLIAVLTTAVALSQEALPTEYKRDVDLGELAQEIQEVVIELSDGSYTSEVIPVVTQIIAQAKALECASDDQDDQAQIEAILERVANAIQNHEKAGKLETFALELNRAFYLWTGLADYLVYINASGDDELTCEALTAVRASGQTILDKLTSLGETFISFDLEDDPGTSDSGRSKRNFCIGAQLNGFCAGLGWRRSVRGIRALLFTDL